jgi:iron complex outermembrane receptor protein
MTTGFGKKVYLPDTTGASLPFPSFRKIFHGVSASMGIAWQLSEKLHLKINVGRGYRAPGITEFASNGLDPGAHIIYLGNRDFLPEFSLQEDIGLGYTGKDFSAVISLFNNNISQYIYLSQLSDANGNPVLDVQGNKTFQYQQSAAQLYGAELNIDFHPAIIKGFSMENAFSVVYGKNKKAAYQHMGYDGEFLPLMPPAKIASAISQEFYPGSKTISAIALRAELEYCAAQNRYLRLYNTETATPGYVLFGVSISTTIKFSKENSIYLQLQGANLFDKLYQSHLSRLKYFEYYTSSPNGSTGMYNMGRNICIKAILSF